jgi:hypothetical protein
MFQPEGQDVSIMADYMSDDEDMGMLSALHGDTSEHARKWALTVVEEIVEDRLRGHVWPLPVRELNGHGGYAGH